MSQPTRPIPNEILLSIVRKTHPKTAYSFKCLSKATAALITPLDLLTAEINHALETGVPLRGCLVCAAKGGIKGLVKYVLDVFADRSAEEIGDAVCAGMAEAASKGHLEVVKYLFFLPAIFHHDNSTALQSASEQGHTEIVSFLLSQGIKSPLALSLAARKGHTEITTLLLASGADANAYTSSALTSAATEGHCEIIRLLFAAGAKTNDWALLGAVGSGNVDVVKLLIDAGADVNVHSGLALVNASRVGNLDIVVELLRNGANVLLLDENALHCAIRYGHLEVVRVLLDAGTGIRGRDRQMMMLAVREGRAKIVQCLIEAGAPVSGEILRAAIKPRWADIVWLLVQGGADVNEVAMMYHPETRYFSECSPLMIATEAGLVDIVEVLVGGGADVHGDEDHAIVCAVQLGKEEVVLKLLELGWGEDVRREEEIAREVGGHCDVVEGVLAVWKCSDRLVYGV